MITFFQAIILGIIQGVTEWLPVSSSGHLVLVQQYFGLSVPIIFYVFLHVGTLLAVLIVFWKDILQILKSLVKTITLKKSVNEIKEDKDLLLAWFIVLGSIPTGLIGYFGRDIFASFFKSSLVVGVALLFTGTWLFISENKKKKIKQLTWPVVLFIGFMQGLAIIPGISRSGATIGAALLLSVNRDKAVRFSFLLAIPAIIGAFLFELKNFTVDSSLIPIIVGSVVALVVGVVCLKWLIRLVSQKKFHLFAYYCWFVGLLVILANLL